MKHDCSALLGLALGGVTLAFAPMADAGETGAPASVNYARPFEPPTRPAFIPLPPGAVEPAGWLRDWCLAARDGFTGHLDEYDDEFKRAWAPDHQMTGEGLLWYKGAWPYEGGGYLRCALAKRHPLVVVRSCFWADAANAARSERSFPHDGVAGHPGDKGMQALADAIVKAVLNSRTKER